MNARGFGRSSIDYPRSAYYMAKVLLALFVGLFRRRPTPAGRAPRPSRAAEPSRRPRRRREPRSPRPMTRRRRAAARRRGRARHAASRSSRSWSPRCCSASCSSWCAGAAWSSATRCCGCSAAVALLVLAIWSDLLNSAADCVGIEVPANALFLAAFGVVFVLLLHFSVATSRLGEETKILAQEVARLDASCGASARGAGERRVSRRPAAAPRSAAADPSSARTTDQ